MSEIEKLRADRLFLAQLISGVTPDRNTQTEEEADAVEDEVMRVVREAYEDAKSRALINP